MFTGKAYDADDSIQLTPTLQMADTSRNVNRVKDLPKDQVYEGVQNPYVLVINNVNFKEDPVPRNGAEHDLENVETFLREAGFESVEKRYDLEKKEMMAAFDETRKSIESGKWLYTEFLPVLLSAMEADPMSVYSIAFVWSCHATCSP